jgi:protocatechuate 3,4-dioxygenase beta subunit
MKTIFFKSLAIVLSLISCSNQPNNAQQFAALKDTTEPANSNSIVGGKCDGCEIMYVGMPANIPSVDTSVAWNEKGQKLFVHGTVYKPDGKTPAPNVILYYWHTDNNGYYSPAQNQEEKSKRHGHIRGWVKTDKEGKYAIYTIRPAPYPNRGIPAHIHMTVKEPNINEYWIDEFLFDDDPLLTDVERKKQENRGGNGVLMVENKNGMQVAERNIVLGLHIPNYPIKDNAKYKSGLSAGEYCPAFDPQFVSGPDKGKRKCPMCSYGFGQGVLMFWNNRDLNQMWTLLRNLDNKIAENGFDKLRAFAIYTNTEKANLNVVERRLTDGSIQHKIQYCGLSFIPILAESDYVKAYKLNNNSAIKNTIFIYRKRKVVNKFVNYESDDITLLLTRLAL